jgi:syntaxin-binding protein 5
MRSLGIQGEITALAVDPVQSIMAIGTSTGLIHLVGSPAFQCTVQLSTLSAGSPNAGIVPVKFLVFMSGLGKLCCVDEKNTLHVWNTGTGGMDDTKNQPLKEITTRSVCSCGSSIEG